MFRKLLLVLVLLVSTARITSAQAISTTTCPGLGCLDIDVANQGSIGIQITGTWVGTITFQALVGDTIGNTTYVALQVFPSNSTSGVTTTTGNGAWSTPIAGFSKVRVVFTAYTSGTAQVIRRVTNQAKAMPSAPSGTGTITGVIAGDGLTGGGTSGTVTVAIDFTRANSWSGVQTFTVNPVVLKANPALVLNESVASDTDFTIANCSDGGGDDNDTFQINRTTTACTTAPSLQMTTSSTTGALKWFLSPDDSNTLWAGFQHVFDENIKLGLFGAGNSGQLEISNSANGENSIILNTSSSARWRITGSGHFKPFDDNSYDVGASDLGVRNTYSYKFIASNTVPPAIAGNATLNTGSADSAGKITATGAGASTAVITFGTAFTKAPACFATNETTAVLARAVSTTSTLTIAGALLLSDVVSYGCIGY